MALTTIEFDLDIRPSISPRIVPISETDTNRQIIITLTDNGKLFNIPSGVTATVEGTLNKHGFAENCTINGSTVSFKLTEAMTASAGRAWTKIKLTKNNSPISTCAFIFEVDKAGLNQSIVSGINDFNGVLQEAFNGYLEKHGTAPIGSGVNSINKKSGVVVLKTSDLENDEEYQTKNDLDTALASKQDKLISGDGILISNDNEISANIDIGVSSINNLTGDVKLDFSDLEDDECHIWFLANQDRYFGDSTIIQVKDKIAIIDFGLDYIVDKNGNKSGTQYYDTVANFLIEQNINHVDLIIISHYHNDHIGGYDDNNQPGAAIRKMIELGISIDGCKVYLPHGNIDRSYFTERTGYYNFPYNYSSIGDILESYFTDNGATCIHPEEGNEVQFATGKFIFRNLSTNKFADYYTDLSRGDSVNLTTTINYNNFAMITEFHHGGQVYLLPSDAEKLSQSKNADDITPPTVYRAEHHALNLIADKKWVEKIAPAIAIIGELWPADNAYARGRLSVPTILRAYNGGAIIYATNESGIVHITSSIHGLAQECETGITYSIRQPIMNQLIPCNSNINSLTEPGDYYSPNTEYSLTLQGLPSGFSGGFYLKVFQASGLNAKSSVQIMRQIFKSRSYNPPIYIRGYDDTNNNYMDWSCYVPNDIFSDIDTFTSPIISGSGTEFYNSRAEFIFGGTKIIGKTVYVYLRFRTISDYQFPAGRAAVTWCPLPAFETPLNVTVNGATGVSQKVIGANVGFEVRNNVTHGVIQITSSETLPNSTAEIIISGSYPLGE